MNYNLVKMFFVLIHAGIKIRIVQSTPSKSEPDLDTKEFEQRGIAEVRTLNLERLIGHGILHTKMWLVDKKHFYLGSANMDWRSLTQVIYVLTVLMPYSGTLV